MLGLIVLVCNYNAWRLGRRVTVKLEPGSGYIARHMHSQNENLQIISENPPLIKLWTFKIFFSRVWWDLLSYYCQKFKIYKPLGRPCMYEDVYIWPQQCVSHLSQEAVRRPVSCSKRAATLRSWGWLNLCLIMLEYHVDIADHASRKKQYVNSSSSL